MTRSELNAHPTVKPALEAWRAARAERDRVTFDGRCSVETRRSAEKAADEAGKRYDAACAVVMDAIGGAS